MSKKQESFNSPIGTFAFPHINRPQDRFKPAKYSVNLRIPTEDAAAFKAELEAKAAEVLEAYLEENPKAKRKPRKPLSIREVVDEEGNPTGDTDFIFRMRAEVGGGDTGKPVIQMRPVVADAKGNKVDLSKTFIGMGSKGRVNYILHPFNNTDVGVSLQMRGVQITSLVEGQSGVSFDPVEDGWTAEASGSSEETGGDY